MTVCIGSTVGERLESKYSISMLIKKKINVVFCVGRVEIQIEI